MTNSIYITTAEPYCGKSLISLGISELLLRKTKRVGIFRPIVGGRPAQNSRDKNIDLILSHFDLDVAYEDTFAFYRREINDLLSQGRYDEIIDTIIQKYKHLEDRCDFILCIGSDFVGEGSAFEFDVNADIAKNLGCPVVIVGHAVERTVEQAISPVLLALEAFTEKECHILGIFVNRAEPTTADDILKALRSHLPDGLDPVLSVIPTTKILDSPTLKEIAQHLEADVLYGEDQLERQAYHYLIAAMYIQNYLPYLLEKSVIISPGDRADVILSTLQAHQSHNYPQISGIVLTSGMPPTPPIRKLLDGLPNIIPILSVDNETYETAAKIGNIRSYLHADNKAKIALSLQLFEEHVDTDALEEQISVAQPQGMTPRMFLYHMIHQAKSNKRHIVLPEGSELRILKATEILLYQDIVDITLLGNKKEIEAAIRKEGHRIDLERVSIIQPEYAPQFFDYVQTLYDLRKDKGLTIDQARELMTDVSYFGTMMVHKGDAHGMVSGSVNTTQHTIRPALQFVKTKPGFSVVSSVFFMCLEDRVLAYGDCAVNPDPNPEQLAEIAIASADTSRAFGIEPKVAMLSYSSGASGKGADVEKVRAATHIAQERRPDLMIEGPIQYDAAVDPTVAKQKLPDSEVAGQATVLIFPDLNTGNNTYKAVQRETGAIAIGPILQGLNKPVNDLSRGATVDDIINTVVITAIQAQNA